MPGAVIGRPAQKGKLPLPLPWLTRAAAEAWPALPGQVVAAKRTRWGAKEGGYAMLDRGLDLLENQARAIAGYVEFPPADVMQVCSHQ